jgi:gliding motility-associatede transport system auxiliary component
MRRPAVVAGLQTVAVLVILGSLVGLAALHPHRLDLTPERRFTLSPYTRDVLGRLTRDVRVTAFYSSRERGERRRLVDLLSLYRDAQPRVAMRLYDLDRSPGIAKRLGVSAYDTLIVEAGERRQRVDLPTEENLTGAILAVAGTPPVPTYFVTGHGEHDPRDDDDRSGASDAARALGTEGFRVEAIDGAAAVPRDAALIVVAGPTHDLRPAEVAALDGYLAAGGNALILSDPGTPRALGALLRRFGIEVGNDLVVDDGARLFGADGLSARVAYVNQEIVPSSPRVAALLPEAQTLRLVDVPGVDGEYLATTGESTWADVDRRSPGGSPPFRPGRDRQGPLPIAVFARLSGGGRLLVVGDADFVTNAQLDALGNRDLLLMTAELAGRGVPVAAARPVATPARVFSPMTLTAREARFLFWTVVVAPAAVLVAAAAALERRRRLA